MFVEVTRYLVADVNEVTVPVRPAWVSVDKVAVVVAVPVCVVWHVANDQVMPKKRSQSLALGNASVMIFL